MQQINICCLVVAVVCVYVCANVYTPSCTPMNSVPAKSRLFIYLLQDIELDFSQRIHILGSINVYKIYVYMHISCAMLNCAPTLKLFSATRLQSGFALTGYASYIRGNQVARFAIIIQYTVIYLRTFATLHALSLCPSLFIAVLVCPTFRPRMSVCIPAFRQGFVLASP